MISDSSIPYRKVMSIAGSDSGGGAGIQADLKTISALGCYATTVITALTAQNTRGVTGIHAVPAEFVDRQIESVLSDIGTDAVKIGMLFSVELIQVVAEALRRHAVTNVVLDPVMVAQSGDKLLQDDAVEALKRELFPLAAVVTPNLPEAAVMLGRPPEELADLKSAATELADLGGRSILIKGGHSEGSRSDDLLYLVESDRFVTLSGPRIETVNTHGTGCTLSSAVAARLACGADIETAVRDAKAFITGAIKAGAAYRLGHGHGPVHHFHRFWK
ncbi:MAG TPA: bifunctional hydroxymethylpyrimidine kinase/phosphomethylpyrimidine kinase [Desulfobacterales bacterium]